MKRILLAIALILMPVFASASSSDMNHTTVACSSATATVILAANTARQGYVIQNVGSYTIYIASLAATTNTGLYNLGAGEVLSHSGFGCFTGAIYGLAFAGQTSVSVDVLEFK